MRVSTIQLVGFLMLFLTSTGKVFGQQVRPAADGPTTYFWGIQRGCVRDGYLSGAVESRLRLTSGRFVAVGNELVAKNPGCLGEECLRSFKSTCTNRQGILVGGVVVQRSISQAGSEPIIGQLVRLWRVETTTGRTTYLQHACRKCDLPTLLPYLTAELLESPPSPSMTANELRSASPPFCAGGETQPEPDQPGEQRIAVVVSGIKEARAARAPLLRVLKEHLSQTGRDVVRAADEGSTHHAPDLASFIGKKVPNDVLGVELLAEGQVRLRLLTAGTLATSENAADCLGCNDAALAKRVVMAAGPLIDRCLGNDCRAEAAMTPLRWSESLCMPSTEPNCPASPPASPNDALPVTTICGALAEAQAVPGHDPPGSGIGAAGPRSPGGTLPRISKARIIGASFLGAAAVGAFIAAGVLTNASGQVADGSCRSADGLLVGGCRMPNLGIAYGPTYAAGALLLGGAVLTLWPLYKPAHPRPKPVTR